MPLTLLEARLAERWSDMAPELAKTKIAGNDLPNARLVAERSIEADIVVTP